MVNNDLEDFNKAIHNWSEQQQSGVHKSHMNNSDVDKEDKKKGKKNVSETNANTEIGKKVRTEIEKETETEIEKEAKTEIRKDPETELETDAQSELGKDSDTEFVKDTEFKLEQEEDQNLYEDEPSFDLFPLGTDEESMNPALYNGFTYLQMGIMENYPFEEGCPVQFRHLTEEEISQIPIMRQVITLMNALSEKEIKLTPQGTLPTKIVDEVYQQGKHSKYADQYQRKTEEICLDVMLIRNILEGAGFIKKRKGMLLLTAKGKKLLKDHNQLLRALFLFLFKDYNVTWLDQYEDIDSGAIGRLYSLWLLHHYCQSWCNIKTLADDYYKAYNFQGLTKAYAFRLFTCLFALIGISEIKHTLNTEKYGDYADLFPEVEIQKNPILEMIFSFEEPDGAKYSETPNEP